MPLKPGRPPHPPETVRGVVVTTWLTHSEAALLKKAIEALKMSQSAFIRDALAEKIVREAKKPRSGIPSVNYK